MPQQPRKTAKSVPDAPEHTPDSWPTVWEYNDDEMLSIEKDMAMRAVGATATTLDQHLHSFMAACAVLLARRHDPSIPVEHWKKLRGRDIKTVQPADLDDEEDPTQRA